MSPHGPQFVILSLDEVERFVAGPRDVCISITSPGARRATLSPNFADVLRLGFHDLGGFSPPFPSNAVPFTEAQADEVARFALAHRDATRLVVHCEAGVCRSVAVALALSSTLYGVWPWPRWYKAEWRRTHYVHNRAVFDLVCAALARATEADG